MDVVDEIIALLTPAERLYAASRRIEVFSCEVLRSVVLYAISIPVNYAMLRRWGRRVGLFRSRWHIDDAVAAGHAVGLLCGREPSGAVEPHYRISPRGVLIFYVSEPDIIDTLTACPRRSELADSGLDCANVTAMPVAIPKVGDEIEIKARIRPVASRPMSSTASSDPEKLVDVFILADVSSPNGVDRKEVYRAWLADQLAEAGTLKDFNIHRLSQHTIWTLIADDVMRPDKGPEVHIGCRLYIKSPTAFAEKLLRGIGEFQAHGLGMLSIGDLLRLPPSRNAVDRRSSPQRPCPNEVA